MTFKWPGIPSPRASGQEIADLAELICWQRTSTSTTELNQFLGRLEDNDYSDSGVPEEEETTEIVQEAFGEIERRKEACRDGYPFAIGDYGYTLNTTRAGANHKHITYMFLLLATRLNMSNNRVHACVDGAHLFERVSAEVAREYFGARAESFVFGSVCGSADFKGKVDDMCGIMGEGGGFQNRDLTAPTANDGKLDVVVWKHFSDRLPSKLIGFGQCKTGTHYQETLAQLQPDSFCRKWLQSFPAVPPVRMFFISEALGRNRWYGFSSDAGLLFDRCRIIDYCDSLSGDTLVKVREWTAAAARATGLSDL